MQPGRAPHSDHEHGILTTAAVGYLSERVDAVGQAVLEIALGRWGHRVQVDVEMPEHGAQPPGELGTALLTDGEHEVPRGPGVVALPGAELEERPRRRRSEERRVGKEC